MTAKFHLTADLTADLSADPGERTHAMAKAFGMALHEAATSPDFRIEMILGEAYAKYSEVVRWLAGEIEKEAPAVQAYAKRMQGRTGPVPVGAAQSLILADAVASLPEIECPKITATGSTGS